MSRETSEWLNTQTRIGFTDKRGTAWHYRAGATNHFPGAVPLVEVQGLFGFAAVSTPLFVPAHASYVSPPCYIDGIAVPDPTAVDGFMKVPGKQAITRSDTGAVLGVFSDGYEIHQYGDWLLERVATILDDGLSIGSAGLLRGGAQAWVSVEVPENITTPEGVVFRPNLTACTSHDGSMATTYKRMVTNVVCDNTLSAGLGEVGQEIKIRHSKYSRMRIQEARDALVMIHTVADDFAAEVEALCKIDVSDKAWSAFLNAHAPVADEKGAAKEGRSLTLALNERDALTALWNRDPRVSPWKGTAFGVLQAVNTHTHHGGTVRNMSRPERNMMRAVTGGIDMLDAGTVKTLTRVLATVG